MADDSLQFATDDTDFTAKMNRKSVLIANGTQLTNLTNTYPGQYAFCTVTGGAFTANLHYKRNSANTSWIEGYNSETDELSTTPVTDDAEPTSSIIGNRYYAYFTLPTTNKYYIITGIEWKNGTVVNGNMICGVEISDAIPTTNNITLSAVGQQTVQTGTSAVQRCSNISSDVIKGGKIIAAFIHLNSATGRIRWLEGQSANNYARTSTYTASPPSLNSDSWVASTIRAYIKIYYRGYG